MNKISFLTRISQIKGKFNGLYATLLTMFMTMAYPLSASASLEDSAKSGGSKIYTLVMTIALIVSLVSISIGWVLHSTGSRKGVQEGNDKLVKGFLSVGGVLLTITAFTWAYQTFVAAGGGIQAVWPF